MFYVWYEMCIFMFLLLFGFRLEKQPNNVYKPLTFYVLVHVLAYISLTFSHATWSWFSLWICRFSGIVLSGDLN